MGSCGVGVGGKWVVRWPVDKEGGRDLYGVRVRCVALLIYVEVDVILRRIAVRMVWRGRYHRV